MLDNRKYLNSYLIESYPTDELINLLQSINILRLNVFEEFLLFDGATELQSAIAVAIFIVTKEMIWNKWDPLSPSLCFNENAFAIFQDKFPMFQLIIACAIEKGLFSADEVKEIMETIDQFMIRPKAIISRKYSTHELEKWS